MSFARWGSDSDVYVYDIDGGYVAHGPPAPDNPMGYYFTERATEMMALLERMRADGHMVPQDCLDELADEAT